MKHTVKSHGTLFRRFFIQITSTVLFCYAVASFLLIFSFASFWKNDIFSQFEGRVSEITAMCSQKTEPNKISEVLSSFYSPHGDSFIVDVSGRITDCSDAAVEGDVRVCIVHSVMSFPEALIESIRSEKGLFRSEDSIEGFGREKWFLVASSFTDASGNEKIAVVMESSDTAYVPYTTSFFRMILSTGLVAVLISFFASLAVSYQMSKPIKKVTSATKQYAGGDFSVKIPEMHTYDEIDSLIESVNTMADSLSVLEESRSNFISNVSHELKTPMTIISGFIDGILDGTIGENERDKYLNIVSDEVRRLSRLVVAMLNMSKIEAGKLELKPVGVNMRKLIFSVLVSFEKVIESKNIEITGLGGLENLEFRADDALINQVVYNLVDNAVKFTPHGGEIRFSLYEEKKTANILIGNTGDGIPTEEAALVFDRFYKVDKSRRLDSHSFGMGLYIVRSIIELHGGTVTVNSEPGRYTEFHIKLPMQ